MEILLPVASSLAVSAISLIGIFLYKSDTRLVHFLMSLAAGTMLAASILHLIPESLEEASYNIIAPFIISGILAMFIVEKAISWHHCHDGKCRKKAGSMVIIGDSIHNFLDGIAIYSAFSLSVPTGIATTISIILHEIPQELGDFGILIHSGFGKKKALAYNFLSALTSVVGVATASFFSEFSPLLAAFSAGSLLYIAMSDIIPEMHKEGKNWLIYHLSGIAAGIVIILLL